MLFSIRRSNAHSVALQLPISIAIIDILARVSLEIGCPTCAYCKYISCSCSCSCTRAPISHKAHRQTNAARAHSFQGTLHARVQETTFHDVPSCRDNIISSFRSYVRCACELVCVGVCVVPVAIVCNASVHITLQIHCSQRALLKNKTARPAAAAAKRPACRVMSRVCVCALVSFFNAIEFYGHPDKVAGGWWWWCRHACLFSAFSP